MNDTNPTNPTDNPVTDSAVGDGDNKPAEAPVDPAGGDSPMTPPATTPGGSTSDTSADTGMGDGDNKPAEAPAMPAGDEPADDTNKPA